MTTYVIKNSSNDVLRIEQGGFTPVAGLGELVTTTSLSFPGWPSQPGKILRYINNNFVEVDTRNLTDVKTAKNLEINAARMAANQNYFVYSGKHIACDPLSRSDIDAVNGIVSLLGTLPVNFPGAWKAMDNTYVTIPDKNAWISFYGAMVSQGTTNFTYSQTLKATLASATTLAEVDAIQWTLVPGA